MKGKKILLGITGGIAAYKSALLLRLLIKEGAEVQVIFTPAAFDFVTPLTFSTLSGKPVLSALSVDGNWVNHVHLGMENDLFIIAPASANTLAKMANGQCDNLLSAVYLSARCPVWVAPAMDLDMFQHPAVNRNLQALQKDGVRVLDPGSGFLASGLEGKGRMQEPEEILKEVKSFFVNTPKVGLKALVTAGPTYEAIDPVRFVGNHSSGKMGVAIAKSFQQNGFEVTLVAGPGVDLEGMHGLNIINVKTADEMRNACLLHFVDSEVCVMAAAVADYKPAKTLNQKLKKKEEKLSLDLVKNPDILAELGKLKKKGQFLIGFALETENGLENAREKMTRKNCDVMLLNNPEAGVSGFGTDTNRVTLLQGNKQVEWSLMKKQAIADRLVKEVVLRYFKK
jgi:phosphopantothenoylcysteine decarboxylase / phosphopantothenate---cysteine ligase